MIRNSKGPFLIMVLLAGSQSDCCSSLPVLIQATLILLAFLWFRKVYKSCTRPKMNQSPFAGVHR